VEATGETGANRTAEATARDPERLHREGLVIDTCSQLGPTVITPAMTQRLDELAAARAPSWAFVVELARMAHESLLADELPGFWDGWDRAGVDAGCVTIGAFGERPFSFENAVRDLAEFTETFDAIPHRLIKATSADDVERAARDGKRAVILAFQNTTHFGDDLDRLALFHQLGVRIMQLTYNSRNLVGDGCTERVQTGLSAYGVEVVRRMNELGVLVDVSHCSDATSLDAIHVSERPVAADHAFCGSVVRHDRAKADDVARAIAERDGYFGVCVVPFFITDDPHPTLDHWLRHVDRAVELAGVERVGIGTDWGEDLPPALVRVLNDEMLRMGFRDEHRVDWAATTEGFRTWGEWPNLTRALVDHGYSDDEVSGLLGRNFLRVFRAAVG